MYKVFISHSTRDQGMVMYLARLLQKFGVNTSVAEWYLSPGEHLDKAILDRIRNSDCVVALLTRHGVRSHWVRQEIDYSLQNNKLVIPIVEKGIESNDLDALQGKEYVEYDPHQYDKALLRLSTYLESINVKKSEKEKVLLVLGGLLAFLLLISGDSK